MEPVDSLLDRDRASYILGRSGLDALVVAKPENVYYATSRWPILSKMGWESSTLAVIPRDPNLSVAYITYQFIYYYNDCDIGLPGDVEPYLITGSFEGLDQANPPNLFAPRGKLTLREQFRRKSVESHERFYMSLEQGLALSLQDRGLLTARIGYDSLLAEKSLANVAPKSMTRDAVDVVKHLRLIKTDLEIQFMRLASAANVAAANATIRKLRELRTLKNVRADFYTEVVKRGNKPVFMSVDGVIDERHDEDLREGSSVLIDCVSEVHGYHGDYGRTIFIGDPPKKTADAAQAVSLAWAELRHTLKPGVRFSKFSDMGQKILAKIGSYTVPFGPHSVGLSHTDQPFTGLDGKVHDIVLEPGMIISVDCPLLEADSGGTIHLEDLLLITENGSEVIHDTNEGIIRI